MGRLFIDFMVSDYHMLRWVLCFFGVCVMFYSGCKFSVEEERVVIELQAQFGNKWARIATYLPGRTDNDVKNFWSSRQKRLARILQTSATPSSSSNSKSHKTKKEVPVFRDVPFFEVNEIALRALYITILKTLWDFFF